MLYDTSLDDYFRVNFAGFIKIIDALGGVDMNVEASFSDRGYSFTQGMMHMNGEEALVYARERYAFSDGDRARGRHQMELINAVMQKILSPEILSKYTEVLASLDGCFETNFSYDRLAELVRQQLTDSGLLSELLIAENQMSWLQRDAEAAKKVTDRINSLPAVKDLRLSDKTAVEATRYAYDNLSDEQKQYVSEDTLKALEEREAEIKRLEEVTPNPTPTPDPNPSDEPKQDEDEDSITLTYQNYPISVTGKLSGYELRLTALKADDDVVKQMQNMISSKEALIRLYDVALYKDGKEVEWNDKLTVNFQVGTSYNGQTLSVLHEGNGKIETLSGTVSNGILSVTASGTGSFGVVVPASTVSTGNGSSNNGSAGTVTNGNLGGGSTGTGNGTTAVSGTGKVTSAKTGDDTDIFFPIAGLITASGVLAGIVLYYKKKKRITGVTEEE